MNDEEIRSTIEQIKAQVKAKPENKDKTEDEIDEMILDSFFQAYTKGEMTKEDLGGLAQILGYEFTEDFDQDPEAPADLGGGEGAGAEPEADAGAEPEGGEGASAEDLEAVRTMEPGESAEDFKEKVDDVKAGEHVEGDDDESNNPDEVAEEGEDGEDEEDDEDAERAKASQLWKMNLNK